MPGNKAMRRAVECKDAVRVGTDLPLITDKTVLMTKEEADRYLEHNHRNRPVNWRSVEEYGKKMLAGKWALHSQGVILDQQGNILTGQNRLWAVKWALTRNPNCPPIYMRVSSGNPSSVADLLDRGRPQSSRDLATRKTEKKHSPTEALIARGILVLKGVMRPSIDQVGEEIANNSELAEMVLEKTARMGKTKAIIMILSAICANGAPAKQNLIMKTAKFAQELTDALKPVTPEKCWGKGTAFAMAMQTAKKIIES